MDSKLRRLLAGVALLAVTIVLASWSQSGATAAPAGEVSAAATTTPNTLTDKEKADGWVLLFDGKSADQWRGYKKQEFPKGWQVIDGELVRKAGGGDIVTKEEYDSFEVVLDYKIAKAGNSGLMFHVTEDADAPYGSGPEVQIQDNVDGHDPQKSGWLYQLYQPPTDPKTGKPLDATKPAGEWNTLRLVLNGPHGEVYMNGVKYEQFELWSDDWNARVAKSKFATMPHFGKAKTGHIDLQDHGDEVAFRSIKLRKLKPAT